LKEIKLGRKEMNVKRNNTIARAHTTAANINQDIEDSAMKHYRESLDDLRDSKK
jgi:vacuolar-type H+-ATPase subunit H